MCGGFGLIAFGAKIADQPIEARALCSICVQCRSARTNEAARAHSTRSLIAPHGVESRRDGDRHTNGAHQHQAPQALWRANRERERAAEAISGLGP